MIADSLVNIENLNKSNGTTAIYAKDDLTIRQQALKEAALALSSQMALYRVSQTVNARLQTLSGILYQAYNFNDLLLPNHVLPPVIQSAYNVSQLSPDRLSIKAGAEVYQIVKQSKFVTVVPTWRDYLWMNYAKPEMPDKSVLPGNQKEQDFWKKIIQIGWQRGYEQGIDIFKQDISKLNRDFNGMLLYRRLVLEHKISQPYVKKHDYGITGNNNKLVINNQSYQLKLLPQFQINSSLWQPVLQGTHKS
ncbi:type IV secretory system conjugative DNA transfer family protein [Fangia hongkongensis]|uniref:type IV secretory system conjugative DNA transfer family protein n=1 Tax=Fangia hongkongensis TaxID=270495 RepID=UPI0003709F79|nr:type IV secretory system conjugative DNA transfer family protein [Fangia hongkongensis]MBK2124620.1 type IV secretory system conjugative DNA transfer family protein [Fangia hongkongensis]